MAIGLALGRANKHRGRHRELPVDYTEQRRKKPEVALATCSAMPPRHTTIARRSTVALEGTVERSTFYNPENGFSVVKLRVRGRRDATTVVGTLPAVQPGEMLVLTGDWQTDPRHGAQFRAHDATVRPPVLRDDIVRYLSSGLVRQLGPVLAERIVQTFGEETLAVLDANPGRVREVPGIGPQRANALAVGWQAHRALRAVTAFLIEHRIDTRYAPRLIAAYGADAPKVLRANPYRLVADVPGFGFAAADRIGQAIAVRTTAPARLQAAVQATLLKAADDGHTRVAADLLQKQAARLAEIEPELAASALTQLLASGVLTTGEPRVSPQASPQTGPTDLQAALSERAAAVSGRIRLYVPIAAPESVPSEGQPAPLGVGLSGLVRAEMALADGLRVLAERVTGLDAARVDRWLATDQAAQTLSEEQRTAVHDAATRGLFVLTGGPGVGKTTTVRVLVRCLAAFGRSLALSAPTGKAAKRLEEVVGGSASTLHRLLGAGPGGFRYGAREPLPHDTVIVDESSMLDTQLARAVVAAIGPRAQLILVGDADQLPSVGPGQVLRDLLASGRAPSARLQTVFRQAARSQIVQHAHAIRVGEVPRLASAAELAGGADCVFVPAAAAQMASVATSWVAERLPRQTGVDPGDVQVLAPLTRVCQTVNSALQTRLNPSHGQAERPHGALPFRVGDRVIQTRNNYTLAVFNGDTGSIVAIENDEVTVDLGDGRHVQYASADLLDLDHAYCLTVHRAQGSEWPAVVILASSDYGAMLTRNLLYTALTRAKRVAVIVGDTAAVARAVTDTRDQQRQTGLAVLLQESARHAAG